MFFAFKNYTFQREYFTINPTWGGEERLTYWHYFAENVIF